MKERNFRDNSVQVGIHFGFCSPLAHPTHSPHSLPIPSHSTPNVLFPPHNLTSTTPNVNNKFDDNKNKKQSIHSPHNQLHHPPIPQPEKSKQWIKIPIQQTLVLPKSQRMMVPVAGAKSAVMIVVARWLVHTSSVRLVLPLS